MSSPAPPYYKHNRLKQLRAFCAAARAGSITGAAEALFLSQPSVSLQIQALERELGTTVFERRGPRIRLTPQGEVLYRLAAPLVKGIDGLHETFAAHYGSLETGEVHIAAGETATLYLLPGPVTRFAEDYPGVGLRLHNVPGREGLALLRSDEVDLAVGPVLERADDVDYHPVVTHDTMLIMPPGHPLARRERPTLAEIAEHGLILPPQAYTTWRVVDEVFRRHGLAYKVALEAGGWEIIKKYVEIGLGVSIVTEVCLTGAEPVAVRSLSHLFPPRTYGVVTRRGRFLSPAAARFIDVFAEYFGAGGRRGAEPAA